MALTRRQREVLEVIRNLLQCQGYSPSLEEIGTELGLSSVATVHKHVSLLTEKGYLRRTWNQNRSIELTDADQAHTSRLPVRGTIAVGRPLAIAESHDTVAVPNDMLRGPGRGYVLRVAGDSMADEQIRDGDLVVIEARQDVRDGETVVAALDGTGAGLRRYYREGDHVRLLPADPSTEPIVAAAERVHVHGVAVGVIRRY